MEARKSTNYLMVADRVKANRADCEADEEVGKFDLPFAPPVCEFAFDCCFVDGVCGLNLVCA
jgi:hypothetical protein